MKDDKGKQESCFSLPSLVLHRNPLENKMENLPKTFKTLLAGRDLTLEAGRMACLANAAVTVRYGDTVVLATVDVSEKPREGVEFFPMLVDYEERLYAAGKISTSRFIKREGRPSDAAILASRLIDRPLRPLFPKNYYNDVQIILTVLSADLDNDPEIISIIAASTALMKSIAPFHGPVGAVRVCSVDGKLILNPNNAQQANSQLNLIVAGNKEKVMMLEMKAAEVSEDKILEAIEFGHKGVTETIKLQETFIAETGVRQTVLSEETASPLTEIKKYLGKKLYKVAREIDKQKREDQINQFENEVLANFEGSYKQIDLKSAFGQILEIEVRQVILQEGLRPDGRKLDELRPLSMEVGILPRTHGSALSTRGQTQALSIVTLGAPGEEQVIETMEEETTKRFMHHYNFPPFSTGEVRPLRSVSRREIGHGSLVEKSFQAVIPSRDEFVYTIRVVSEILSSNGSSSMAAVCGSTLALMDAGVPIKAPVAGISIGLVKAQPYEKSKKDHVLLTDIQGIEDFAGDMDFKVAGTKNGVTAIQLDIKINGLDIEIIKEALAQAKKSRLEILDKMTKIIASPRSALSPYAPRIQKIQIPVAKIGELIGPGGKNIRAIIEQCGGKEVISIDIEDDGTVIVTSTNAAMSEKALATIGSLTKEIMVGEIYEGPVTQIVKDRMRGNEIGAIVQILPNKDGMVHISQMADHRVDKIADELKIGQIVKVKVMEVDKERGRISLSIKAAVQAQK